MNNIIFLAIIIEILLVLPMMQTGEGIIPSGLSDKERYNTGYKWGCSDARAGGYPYLNSHPTHTKIFMNGYKKGYVTCSSGKAPSSSITGPVNRNNLFNDLSNCKAVEKWLTHTCSFYVNSQGVLTKAGKIAKGCISNGILLTASAAALTGGALLLSPSLIIGLLEPLSDSTGCGGIVNWSLLESDANAATRFLLLLGIR